MNILRAVQTRHVDGDLTYRSHNQSRTCQYTFRKGHSIFECVVCRGSPGPSIHLASVIVRAPGVLWRQGYQETVTMAPEGSWHHQFARGIDAPFDSDDAVVAHRPCRGFRATGGGRHGVDHGGNGGTVSGTRYGRQSYSRIKSGLRSLPRASLYPTQERSCKEFNVRTVTNYAVVVKASKYEKHSISRLANI